jgi:hypothetical protein
MSDDKIVVETFYGKYSKFEVVKDSSSIFGSPKFYIYKDGKNYRGSFSSLKDAVEAAKKEAER